MNSAFSSHVAGKFAFAFSASAHNDRHGDYDNGDRPAAVFAFIELTFEYGQHCSKSSRGKRLTFTKFLRVSSLHNWNVTHPMTHPRDLV